MNRITYKNRPKKLGAAEQEAENQKYLDAINRIGKEIARWVSVQPNSLDIMTYFPSNAVVIAELHELKDKLAGNADTLKLFDAILVVEPHATIQMVQTAFELALGKPTAIGEKEVEIEIAEHIDVKTLH